MIEYEKGPSRDRGVALSSPLRADEREAEPGPQRSPEQVVHAKFAAAKNTLDAIAEIGIPKLAAAQPFAGDRRTPRQRRAEYDLAKEGIAVQLKNAGTTKTTAIEHAKQHGVDTTAMVREHDQEIAKIQQQLRQAPEPPPAFQRIRGEDALLAAVRMPPGEARNTEIISLVSELDTQSARVLRGRLDTEPDPEDALAQAFKQVVAVRADVLGILAGTKRMRVDRRKRPPGEHATAGFASAEAPPQAEDAREPSAVQRKARIDAVLPVQRKAKLDAAATPEAVASEGFQGGGGLLPHLAQIQHSFGRHDVTDVRAHHGPAAQQAAAELGADAYASGRDVAFAKPPDLRTASHEAAHVVQQRFGVQLLGGIDGGASDPYEQHADEVAEAVVGGRSAEPILDRMAGGGGVQRAAVQRSSASGAAQAHEAAPVPPRGDYFVERTADSYVFVFNTFDRRAWSEPVLTGLRYYMHQVFPGIGDDVIRTVFTDLKVRFEGSDARTFPDDKRYELTVAGKLHHNVIAWMASHHPTFAPQEPKQGGAGLRTGDGGADADHAGVHGAQPQATARHATTMTADKAGTDKVSAKVEEARTLYDRLRQTFPGALVLRDRAAWPDFLEFATDHGQELQKVSVAAEPSASRQDLLKLLAQFRAHRDAKQDDHASGKEASADTKPGGDASGTKDGDVRATRDGGIEHGSIHGEPGGDALGWHKWQPKGQLRLKPAQATYVAGSAVEVELAWDLSVHADAGQILLPNHCSYAWAVHRGSKLVDSAGHSMFADDRRASLDLGKVPGTYEIAVTATSKHFKTEHHRFAASLTVQAVSESSFDRAAFDQAQLAGPDAAFSRDDKGALHLNPGQTAHTVQDEIGNLDLTRGGIDTLAAQGKVTADDHDIAAGELAKQRKALLEIQAKVKNGTPYVVRGTFVSREDSSTTPLRLMMHVLRRDEAGGVARYELILHDTTFGDAVQHPGAAAWRLDHDNPAAVYRRLEGEALEQVIGHFHAHNDYPKGTVHLAAQRLADSAVWEKTLDTDNGRKTFKRGVSYAAAIGGAAMMIVPGGNVVAVGLMVATSAVGVASVALEVEDQIAKEGHLKLDRRLAMDVLQIAAIALPLGTLTKTFAAAKLVSQGRFLLCMVGLDTAQGFVIASDVKERLAVIDASTAIQLAQAASDDQRTAIHAERDRRVAEVIGGAVVNGGFLLISLGHGIKKTIAVTRAGSKFTVREPVRELATRGREGMEQALTTDVFEHDGERVQITAEERRYLEHEIAAHEPGKRAQSNAPVGETSGPAEGTQAPNDTTSGPAKNESPPSASVIEPTDPEEWMARLEEGLSPDEKTKLAKMKGEKTPAEQRAMFDGDLEASRKKVRDALRAEQEAAAAKAKSKVRVEELRREIDAKGMMNDPEIRAIVDDASMKPRDKVPALRDKLMAKILKAEAHTAHPNAEVLDNVKIYEKQPETTYEEWQAHHPEEGTEGLTQRPDGLYLQRGELDMMIVERDPAGGKGKIVSREEIKTGIGDSDAKAKSQLRAQSDLFKDAASGARTLRLEIAGRDIAGELDLASDATATKSTRGPSGKGFDRSLGITATDLEALCKDLLKSSPAPGRTP